MEPCALPKLTYVRHPGLRNLWSYPLHRSHPEPFRTPLVSSDRWFLNYSTWPWSPSWNGAYLLLLAVPEWNTMSEPAPLHQLLRRSCSDWVGLYSFHNRDPMTAVSRTSSFRNTATKASTEGTIHARNASADFTRALNHPLAVGCHASNVMPWAYFMGLPGVTEKGHFTGESEVPVSPSVFLVLKRLINN